MGRLTNVSDEEQKRIDALPWYQKAAAALIPGDAKARTDREKSWAGEYSNQNAKPKTESPEAEALRRRRMGK